ncbi:ATP-binding cassette domain-containing protein, partial [Streptomyces sp. ME02-6979-3A]|nr:ATP-binding cassette domain-containing protein [Streptomyces sp. ME02-6979-3A]
MLRGLDLDLPAHTLVRIEGANGVGKSTLLRLLAGIDAPTEGRMTGRPRTAYVPERFPAALPFTAAGYLTHMGRVHGLPAAEAAARGQEWLARFGAAGYARTPLAELSKGTSQKVAVAQALLAGPDLLVLDEAWTGLDTEARGALDRAVAERAAGGATVVFVDHDPGRLAGAVGLAYRLEDRTLTPVPASPGDDGPRVRIEATGRPSAALPPELPGAPAVDGTPGTPPAPGPTPPHGPSRPGRRPRTVRRHARPRPLRGPGRARRRHHVPQRRIHLSQPTSALAGRAVRHAGPSIQATSSNL